MAVTCRKVLELYLERRACQLSKTALSQYRWSLTGFIDFLEAASPPINDFSELTRDHVISWLEDLKDPKRHYSQNSRCLIVFQVRRVLRDILAWDWPGSPPAAMCCTVPNIFPPHCMVVPSSKSCVWLNEIVWAFPGKEKKLAALNHANTI